MKPSFFELFGQVLPKFHFELSEDEYMSIRSNGNLVFANRSFDIHIPQIPIKTLQDFFATIDKIKKEALSKNLSIFFRGQNRDYFSKDKCLSTLPSAYRNGTSSPFGSMTNMEEINTKLLPWIEFLEDKGIELGEYLTFNSFNDGSDLGVLRFTEIEEYSDSFYNFSIIGILQHYGFPTHFIDISENEIVSLWFALNKGQELSDGKIKMEFIKNDPLPITWETPEDVEAWPSLHVYFHSLEDEYWSIYDLQSIEEIKSFALRPLLQKAFVMPYKRIIAIKSPIDNNYHYVEKKLDRWPTYVLKIGFDTSEFREAFPNFSRQYLLPDNDLLYQELLSKKLPYLVIYD